MPSPVTPSQFCDAIPANNADFCTRFTKWLNVPSLLCRFFNWALTSSGALSTDFKAEMATYSTPTGTFTFSATLNMGGAWLLCDGSEVSRTTYAALFNEVGTRYGAGDGVNTFTLPDFRGRSPIGAGAGTGLTNRDINTVSVGEETHVQTVAELAVHSHEVPSIHTGGSSGTGMHVLNDPPSAAAVTVPPHETEETGGGNGFNVIHPCLITYVFIKT